MADQLFVDETGKLFKPLPDGGYQYVGDAPKAAPPKPTDITTPEGRTQGRIVERALKEGFFGLPKFMADAVHSATGYLDRHLPIRTGIEIPFDKPSEVMEKFIRTPQPESRTEQLVGDVGAGAISGGLLGAVNPVQKVSQAMSARLGASAGAGGAAGGDIAGQAFPEAGPLATVPGAILGGILGGGAGARMPTVIGGGPLPGGTPMAPAESPGSVVWPTGAGRIRDAAGHLPDTDFQIATKNVKEGQAGGIKLLAPQAFPERTPLLDLQERLTGAPVVGPTMSRELQNQSHNVQMAGGGLLDTLAPPTTPQAAAKGAAAASQKAVEGVKDFRTTVTKPDYEFKIPEVTQKSVQNFEGQLKRVMAGNGELGPTTPAGQFLQREILDKLKVNARFDKEAGNVPNRPGWSYDPGAIPGEPEYIHEGRGIGLINEPKAVGAEKWVARKENGAALAKAKTAEELLSKVNKLYGETTGDYETTTKSLDAVLKGAEKKLQDRNVMQENGIDDHVAGQIRGALSFFNAYLDKFRVGAKQADTLHKEVTERVVQPQTEGLPGQILGGRGFQPGRAVNTGRITSLMLDEKKVNAQQILDGAKVLGKQDPKAFPALVRSTIQQKLDAIQPEDPNGIANFVGKVAGQEGTPLRENFRAMVAGAAGPQNAAQAVAGAERLLKAIELAGRGRGGMTGGVQEAPQTSLGSAVKGAGALVLYPPQAPGVAARAATRIGERVTNAKIVDLFTAGTPESIETLRQLARRDPMEIARAISWGTVPQIAIQGQREEK